MISKCSCVFVLCFDFKITAVFLMPANSGTRALPLRIETMLDYCFFPGALIPVMPLPSSFTLHIVTRTWNTIKV
jgi:hypothetical protein